jgi:glycine cleavage system H protein
MAADLTFMMGKFAALLPGALRYATTNHMWCRENEGRWRFGFTSYALRLMQDVYFLDWVLSAGDEVKHLQQIGHIETSKAVADLFAPMTGKVLAFNESLLSDPSTINVDHHGAGWLFEMAGDGRSLVDVSVYHQFLDDNWEKTQRLIKGKINTED